MVGMSVVERLEKIHARIEAACRRAGRAPRDVKILAVSKFHPLQAIRDAFEAGQRDFAENYLQEAEEKQEQLASMPVNWHYIGRIQSNKVKNMIGRFAMIHSVDRPVIAEAIHKLATDQQQKILLQYNVAGEESKGGLNEFELDGILQYITGHGLKNISVCGFMVMPPLSDDPEKVRPYFVQARKKLGDLRKSLSAVDRALHPMDQLSMGTSQDFEVAIEEGATWIRVGTEIFGQRVSAGREQE
jgi:PLP dependent protein